MSFSLLEFDIIFSNFVIENPDFVQKIIYVAFYTTHFKVLNEHIYVCHPFQNVTHILLWTMSTIFLSQKIVNFRRRFSVERYYTKRTIWSLINYHRSEANFLSFHMVLIIYHNDDRFYCYLNNHETCQFIFELEMGKFDGV